MGIRLCNARPSSAGVRSPPLRGGEPGGGGLAGKGRGMTREVVFSEGRGLRARVARPEASRATSRLWTSWRQAGGQREETFGLALCRHCGRAEPAPPRNGQAMRGRPCGGKPGDSVEGDLLGGTHSVRPRCKAGGKPRHNIIIGGKRAPGGPMGRSPGGGEASFAGVRSPPLLEGQAWVRGLAGENPGMALRGVLLEQLSPSFLGQLPHYAPCPELTVDIGARTLASLGKLWIVATEVTVSNLKFLAHGHGFLIRMSPALHLSPSGENPSLLSEFIAGGTSGQRSSSPLDDIDAPKG